LAEERLVEQQMEIERLQKKLSSSDTELETASGSADSLKQQVSEAMAEVAHYKLLIAQGDDGLATRDVELQQLRWEVSRLEECLSISEQARCDLSNMCAERIR
jgi:chromosome segregation ATPase